MILVAGTTLPLASNSLREHNRASVPLANRSRGSVREVAAHRSYLLEHGSAFWSAVRFPLIQCLWIVCKVAQIYLCATTFTWLILRMKRPRPALCELLRQPGTVAGLAIVFGQVCVSGYLDYFFYYFKSHVH